MQIQRICSYQPTCNNKKNTQPSFGLEINIKPTLQDAINHSPVKGFIDAGIEEIKTEFSHHPGIFEFDMKLGLFSAHRVDKSLYPDFADPTAQIPIEESLKEPYELLASIRGFIA